MITDGDQSCWNFALRFLYKCCQHFNQWFGQLETRSFNLTLCWIPIIISPVYDLPIGSTNPYRVGTTRCSTEKVCGRQAWHGRQTGRVQISGWRGMSENTQYHTTRSLQQVSAVTFMCFYANLVTPYRKKVVIGVLVLLMANSPNLNSAY